MGSAAAGQGLAKPAAEPCRCTLDACRRVWHDGVGEWVDRFADHGERARSWLIHTPARVTKSPRHAVWPRRTLPALPGRNSSADWTAPAREAAASIAPAPADQPRMRDARAPRARHDAEDDCVRVRDLDQHGRQPRGERVQEARRPRRGGRSARAPGRAFLLRNPRRFRAHARAPQGEPLDIVLPMTASLKVRRG